MNIEEFRDRYTPLTPIETKIMPKIQGWNSDSITFDYAIVRFQPKSIVEVGTWLGASAIHIASLTKAPIICVDTFLGSNEVLWREGNVNNLTVNFDYIYRQFCANITSKELNTQITPLPMTSSSAAELFAKHKLTVDMVYLDAGHQEREVYADLQDWWPLTNKVLVGDDYNNAWPGVIKAVTRFVEENDLDLFVMNDKFVINKVN
jgi:cephalosporin hydroxylase